MRYFYALFEVRKLLSGLISPFERRDVAMLMNRRNVFYMSAVVYNNVTEMVFGILQNYWKNELLEENDDRFNELWINKEIYG